MNVMTLPEIMDRSLDVLRKHVKSIVLYTLIYGIIVFIAMIPAFIVLAIILAVTVAAGAFGTVIAIAAVLIALPLVAGIALSYNIGLIKIVAQDILKEKVMAFDAIKASFKSFFKAMGIGAVAAVIALPVLAVLGGIGYFVFNSMDFLNSLDLFWGIGGDIGFEANIILLTVVSLTVFLVICLIICLYLNWFSFSFQALILEKTGVIASVKRSFILVKGSFWRILGCMTLFYLTVYVISLSLQSFFGLVGGLIYLLLQFLNIPQDAFTFITVTYNYSGYPVSILSWLVISPLWTIMSTLLYYNRRFVREGYDISLKLDTIRQNSLKETN